MLIFSTTCGSHLCAIRMGKASRTWGSALPRVRAIFALFEEHGSALRTLTEIERRGWRLKSWTLKTGQFRVRDSEGGTGGGGMSGHQEVTYTMDFGAGRQGGRDHKTRPNNSIPAGPEPGLSVAPLVLFPYALEPSQKAWRVYGFLVAGTALRGAVLFPLQGF